VSPGVAVCAWMMLLFAIWLSDLLLDDSLLELRCTGRLECFVLGFAFKLSLQVWAIEFLICWACQRFLGFAEIGLDILLELRCCNCQQLRLFSGGNSGLVCLHWAGSLGSS